MFIFFTSRLKRPVKALCIKSHSLHSAHGFIISTFWLPSFSCFVYLCWIVDIVKCILICNYWLNVNTWLSVDQHFGFGMLERELAGGGAMICNSKPCKFSTSYISPLCVLFQPFWPDVLIVQPQNEWWVAIRSMQTRPCCWPGFLTPALSRQLGVCRP